MATNSTASLNDAYNSTAGTVSHISLHTADPGATGANEVTGGTYTRIAQTYGSPTAGAGDLSGNAVFNVPASNNVTHWGAWDGSTFRFGAALQTPQSFGADGTYTLTSAPYNAANPS